MERRKHPRSEATVRVCIRNGSHEWHGFARDVSSRGIYIDLDPGSRCDADRKVKLHFEIDTGEQVLSRQLRGRIVRNEGNGLAIRFEDHDIVGRAVVHELIFYMELCCAVLAASRETRDGGLSSTASR